ncbi:MAG: glutathione S-transferase [Candidatus Cloacimonetes bacterium]|nr:glutathione S-transferase [Candidatus Cloacimonadota bacterium]
MSHPILYSFRRCPYAMRARLALKLAETCIVVREITLKNKPQEMLAISPKGTVPVVFLPDGTVIEESLDIMIWALTQSDPSNILSKEQEVLDLIKMNDSSFKYHLDRYKYSDRHPEHPMEYYRSKGEEFLTILNQLLMKSKYLYGDTLSFADIAIFPFVRQFAHVDRKWFFSTKYSYLIDWLNEQLESELFLGIMQKYPEYLKDDQVIFI